MHMGGASTLPCEGAGSVSEIKNFPHQYNDLDKLRQTAEVYAALRSEGGDPSDDGELGYALVEERIYRFRGLDYDAPDPDVAANLAERITAEKAKPRQSQGPRTAAREMRRTMRALGWISEEGALTKAGQALLRTAPGSEEELEALRAAMMEVTATDPDGNVSHPMRILMRLVEDVRFDSREGMELALVAKDDSAEEYHRILRLARLDPDTRQAALDATAYQVANAVKILPAFLLNTGMIREDGTGHYVTTAEGRAAFKAAVGDDSTVAVSTAAGDSETADVGGGVTRRPRAKEPAEVGGEPEAADVEGRALTPEQQRDALRRLMERTQQHQSLVRVVAGHCGDARVYEDPLSYDLLFEPEAANLPLILWEAKTIDGDHNAQVRAAVGQLAYYDFFYVRSAWKDRRVLKAAVFDEEPTEQLCAFMEEQGCAAFLVEEEELRPMNDLAETVWELLGQY